MTPSERLDEALRGRLAEIPTNTYDAILAAVEAHAAEAQRRSAIFVDEPFTSHSGRHLPFKIECDALTDTDIATLAHDISRNVQFGTVEGVPRGGLRIADALRPYATAGAGLLIVDDVLTTGASMEEQRNGRNARGIVLFARGRYPAWVTPLFTYAMTEPMTASEPRWPPPEPQMQWGLYHYLCECPECGEAAWSDKGMLRPELAYQRHWLRRHSGWVFVDPGDVR